MSDVLDDDSIPDAERKRYALRRVAAYRDLQARVRKGTTSGLLFGGFMLAIWYVLPDREKFNAFGLIFLGLAGLEFAAALWNRIAPSAEGVLVDGIVTLTFGATNLIRYVLIWQGILRGRPNTLGLVFGAWMLFNGFQHLKAYLQIRQVFVDRPTAEHLRWFDGLLADVRAADPEMDADALNLPVGSGLRAKLLGDTAIFVDGHSEVVIAAREDVFLHREPGDDPSEAPTGVLELHGTHFGPFLIDPANWRNYAAWKADGGELVK